MHGKTYCSECGTLIRQCRCIPSPGGPPHTTRYEVCRDCRR